MEKMPYHFLLALGTILAFVPVIVLYMIFAGRLDSQKVDSEIVNGLVTVSGLIFAFQPTYFKIPRKGRLRLHSTAIFSVEGLLLGITGYSYVSSTLDLGFLSRYTLFIASGSLVYNIFMTIFFMLADLVYHSEF